jgi:hypothetical protein
MQLYSSDTSSLGFSFSGVAAFPGAARPGPIGQANFFEGTMTGLYRPATPGSDSKVTTGQYATGGSDGKSLGATLGAATGGALASDPLVHTPAVTLPTYSRDWAVSWWDPNTGRIGTVLFKGTVAIGAQVIASGHPGIGVHGGLMPMKNWRAGPN